MVAQTIELPNVRKIFIPDPGYLVVDADLAGADAQVVAWEANDEDLKDAFRKGLKLHIKNARDVYPELTATMSDADLKATDRNGGLYYNCKRRVHATNYVGSAKTIAQTLRTRIAVEEEFQQRWFELHPGIKEWHRRIDHQLARNRTVSTKLGFSRTFFDRVEQLLPEAVAWIPQATVANVCAMGGVRVRKAFPWVEFLLQVHDSLVFQIPYHREDSLPQVVKEMHVEVPYSDPLVIPWGIKVSKESWGHC